MSVESIHWHTLHPRYLGRESRVLDVGANIGEFARAVVDRFGCRCVAVEPSQWAFDRIPTDDRIVKRRAAVTPAPGQADFHVSTNSVASSLAGNDTAGHVRTESVPGVTLAGLMGDLGWDGVDLLKCDIEGAEIDVLAATSDALLRSVGQITIEFHDFCGITPRAAVLATLSRLHALGFASVRMSRVGHQDTWLINRRLCPISTAELLYIRHVVRNAQGFRRVAGRVVGRLSGRRPTA